MPAILVVVDSLVVVHHASHGSHAPPPSVYHPECPLRADKAMEALSTLPGVEVMEEPLPDLDPQAAIDAAHDASYVRLLQATVGGLDSDTYISPTSYRSSLDGMNCWLNAGQVAASGGGPAFVVSRPPGHHATRAKGMGFCLVNYCACVALHHADGLGRNVAICDFDVHHGNGIEDIVAGNDRVRYFSASLAGIYGGGDDGVKAPNVRKSQYNVGDDWVGVIEEGAKWLSEINPDLVIVSAGYDALGADSLAGMTLEVDDFYEATRRIARHLDVSKTFFGLEGGYALDMTFGMPAAVRRTAEALVEAEALLT